MTTENESTGKEVRTPPEDQQGPICPHCKTKPFVRYGISQEITREMQGDQEVDGDLYSIVYCEDCWCVLAFTYVGPSPEKINRIQAAMRAQQANQRRNGPRVLPATFNPSAFPKRFKQ